MVERDWLSEQPPAWLIPPGFAMTKLGCPKVPPFFSGCVPDLLTLQVLPKRGSHQNSEESAMSWGLINIPFGPKMTMGNFSRVVKVISPVSPMFTACKVHFDLPPQMILFPTREAIK